MAWLVEHAAYVRNARIIGSDGRTAHQRARGTKGTTTSLAFGELCRYKARAQEAGIGSDQDRWGAGVWLGVDGRTGQYVVYDKDHGGVGHTRTIKAMPQGHQWSMAKLQEVDALPWSAHVAPPPAIEPQTVKEPDMKGRRPIVRRIYIKQTDLDKHGYTEHCPRCDHLREARPGKAPNHSEACRARITAAIAATPEGAARLQASEERADRFIADQIETQDQPPHVAQGECEVEPVALAPSPVQAPVDDGQQGEWTPLGPRPNFITKTVSLRCRPSPSPLRRHKRR